MVKVSYIPTSDVNPSATRNQCRKPYDLRQ